MDRNFIGMRVIMETLYDKMQNTNNLFLSCIMKSVHKSSKSTYP